MADVSIVIVNYNSGEFLEQCVASLQCRSEEYEIAVVDNASTDLSVGFLKQPRTDRVSLHQNQENLGFSRAANQGVSLTEGQYVLLLNPDCLILPDTIQSLAEFLETNSECGLCGGLVLDFFGREQAGCRRHDPTPVSIIGKGLTSLFPNLPFPTFDLTFQPLPQEPVPVDAVSGSFMMVRRDVHKSIQGFDEAYFLHFEDLDYCRRVRESGFKVFFLPDAPVFHYQGAAAGIPEHAIYEHKRDGMLRYLRRSTNARPSLALVLLSVLSALGLVTAKIIGVFRTRRPVSKKPHPALGGIALGDRPVMLVLGARSDIGQFLLPRLSAAGWAVLVITRWPDELPAIPGVAPLHPTYLENFFARKHFNVDGIISSLPISLLLNFKNALQAIPAQRLRVFFDSNNMLIHQAGRHRKQQSGATVGAGETWADIVLQQVGRQSVIARSMLVYGGTRNKNIKRIKYISSICHVVPRITFQTGLCQPVHADDLAEWCLRLTGADISVTGTTSVTTAGAEQISFAVIVQRSALTTGGKLLEISVGKTALQAIVWLAQLFMLTKYLPPLLIHRLQEDFCFANDDARKLVKFSPRNFHP